MAQWSSACLAFVGAFVQFSFRAPKMLKLFKELVIDWGYGSADKVVAVQAWGPDFKAPDSVIAGQEQPLLVISGIRRQRLYGSLSQAAKLVHVTYLHLYLHTHLYVQDTCLI